MNVICAVGQEIKGQRTGWELQWLLWLQMDKRRLSGDWERAALGMPPKLRLPGSQGSDMNRLGSTPQLSGIPAIQPVNPTAARISRASMTDMPESPSLRTPRGMRPCQLQLSSSGALGAALDYK